MTEPVGTGPEEPIRQGKYARVERERRFLLAGPPPASAVTVSRRITDRYLPGTRLRLRRVDYLDSRAWFGTWARGMAGWWEDHDLLVTPTVGSDRKSVV